MAASVTRPLRLIVQPAQAAKFACPLCGSEHAAYVFGGSTFRVHRCAGCALTFAATAADGDEIAELPPAPRAGSENRQAALRAALSRLKGKKLLVVADDTEIVPLIEESGPSAGRVVGHRDLDGENLGGPYQGVVLTSALMRARDPRAALAKIRKSLEEGAPLVASLPMLDSAQARLMGRSWPEWQRWNRWYFTRETLQLLLLASGFAQVWFRDERRRYSLDTLVSRMRDSDEVSGWIVPLQAIHRVSPRYLRAREFSLPSGTAVTTAVAAPIRGEKTVSIIVPVFNEAATVKSLLDALMAKQVPGFRREIIIVESNSTDGSREIVQSYADYPDVRIVLQPAPRGKGNAVREGLALATGDVIIIQDADLEYDLEDYGGLLEPLAAWQSMFVLGSRHQGGWKMRKFSDSPLTAAVFNLGHVFFRDCVNLACGTRIADPFTMFKVFRRDALFGMALTCNRFDLDIELVIKLIRKGYVPIELPVNYVSRSLADGKKVRVFRDGATWVWTILKARLTPVGPGPA